MNSKISKILVAHPERILRDAVCEIAREAFRQSEISTVAKCREAHEALASAFDLVVTDVIFPDGDILDLAPRWTRTSLRRPPILVVTQHKEARVLECIQDAGVGGVFDSAAEGIQKLKEALLAVASGREYASPTIVERMPRFTFAGANSSLTPLERLVLATIGDGSSDGLAARRLKRAKLTIHTVRRDIHRKLGVSDRGELIHAAVRLGFICFTEHGVVRPGFKRLLGACPRRTIRSVC